MVGYVIALNILSYEKLTISFLFLSYVPMSVMLHIKSADQTISSELIARQVADRMFHASPSTTEESNVEVDKILSPTKKYIVHGVVAAISYLAILACVGLS